MKAFLFLIPAILCIIFFLCAKKIETGHRWKVLAAILGFTFLGKVASQLAGEMFSKNTLPVIEDALDGYFNRMDDESEIMQIEYFDTELGGGDNGADGYRKAYTLDELKEGKLGNTIVFNSMADTVNGVYRDERNFVFAAEDIGTDGESERTLYDEIEVQDGEEYIVYMYVQNNNPNGDMAVAENVRVAFSVPGSTSYKIPVTGEIFSSNAFPSKYWDNCMFKSDHVFHLEYMPDSAFLKNNIWSADAGVQLSDSIIDFPDGIFIGYDRLDGEIPGGYQYGACISIKLKVVFDILVSK